MKKLVGIIMFIVGFAMAFICPTKAEDYNDSRDYVTNTAILNDFNMAFENGDPVYGSDDKVYVYNNIVYGVNGYLYITEYYGYTGPVDQYHTKEMAECLKNILAEEGAQNPLVWVAYVGENNLGEAIFETIILMGQNINDYHGEKTGNGYLKDNFVYYGIKNIGRIY